MGRTFRDLVLALWPISPMFPKARRHACSPKCSGSKPRGPAMDNPLDAFAPLTEAELTDAARQVPQDFEADAPQPTCPPPDAENGVLGGNAALLVASRIALGDMRRRRGKQPTMSFAGMRGDGKKVIRPLSWFDGEGWRVSRLAKQPSTLQLVCHRRTTKRSDHHLRGRKGGGRGGADLPQ